ncbi:MAG: MotA/TolQ/ExbB proton channel family protein [Neisseriaceae bacterium]|nr:MotA/TolQ/ExbB proton channel family protein [Neisseriaceae bacterium]
MWTIIQQAGWPIWLIIAASVASVAIILDRLVALRRRVVLPLSLIPEFERKAADVTQSLPEHACASSLGRVLSAAWLDEAPSQAVRRDNMENQAQLEAVVLEKHLTLLGTIAAMAPLLGLLGTVIGMIEIFAAQSPSGTDPQQLARGISVALYNTAFGLLVAIPSMMFYRHFRAKVEVYLTDMEVIANRLWHQIGDRAPKS